MGLISSLMTGLESVRYQFLGAIEYSPQIGIFIPGFEHAKSDTERLARVIDAFTELERAKRLSFSGGNGLWVSWKDMPIQDPRFLIQDRIPFHRVYMGRQKEISFGSFVMSDRFYSCQAVLAFTQENVLVFRHNIDSTPNYVPEFISRVQNQFKVENVLVIGNTPGILSDISTEMDKNRPAVSLNIQLVSACFEPFRVWGFYGGEGTDSFTWQVTSEEGEKLKTVPFDNFRE